MSSELSRNGFSSRSINSASLGRQLKRETEVVAAETEREFIIDAAHAFLASASIQNLHGVLADAREAIADDPLGAELYGSLVRAYADGATRRLNRFGQ